MSVAATEARRQQQGLDIDDLFDSVEGSQFDGDDRAGASGSGAGRDAGAGAAAESWLDLLEGGFSSDDGGDIMSRDSTTIRLEHAGLVYSADELTANPKLKRLEKYHVRMVDDIKAHNFKGVYATYKRMVSKGLQVDLRTYNLVLEAASRARRTDLFFKLTSNIIASGLDPDTTTYNTLIRGFARVGNLADAVKLYKSMRRDRFDFETVPDRETYTALMSAALAVEEVETAFKYFNIMVHENHVPQEVHFYMLYKYLFERNNLEYVTHVFRTMMNYQRHFVPSLDLCSYLERHCMDAEQLGRELWHIVHRHAKLYPKQPPSDDTLRHTFDKLVAEGLYREARQLVNLCSETELVSSAQSAAMEREARRFPEPSLDDNFEWGPDGSASPVFRKTLTWGAEDEEEGGDLLTGEANDLSSARTLLSSPRKRGRGGGGGSKRGAARSRPARR